MLQIYIYIYVYVYIYIYISISIPSLWGLKRTPQRGLFLFVRVIVRFMEVLGASKNIPPLKINGWNLNITQLKRNIIRTKPP